ncbi:FHA domain-containing protein [Mycobacterium kansasii]|nr:FHA domain-containing protein [Mycobacterium kansasii]
MRTTTFAAPLTVWVGTTMYTFAPGRDVTVGRDIRSDICLSGPDSTWVSREHFVLRFDGGHWVVIDRSRNGTYLNGVRVSTAMIRSGQHITAGDPLRGPRLVFEVGVPPGAAIPGAWVGPAPPSAAASSRQPESPRAPPNPPPTEAQTLPGFPAIRLQPAPEPPSEPPSEPDPPSEPSPADPAPAADAAPDDSGYRATGSAAPSVAQEPLEPERTLVKRVIATTQRLLRYRHRSLRIGRSPGSDITVHDPLVSRVHAVLRPTVDGWEIRDKGSRNGTYVNAERVRRVLLREGDTVTVGNADFAFCDTTLVPRSTSAGGGVSADGLGLAIDGHQLLTDVSFTARPGTLTAVIGPPGAGKSSVIALLSGAARPTSGLVTCDGHNLHAGNASMRSRVAIVPHHAVMHDRLAVEQIVSYAAELRLPPDTSAAERRAAINQVIDEADLGAQRAVKAGNLSAGERKRLSVAIELLTGPSLVVFEEPNGKPDRGLDRQVMTTARRLADAGRVVVVATHSLAALNLCDQVLLLASGEVAFAGPPADIEQAVSKARWSQAFPPGGGDADGAGDAAPTDHRGGPARQPPEASGEAPERSRRTSLWRQTSMLIRRQVRLIASDRGYLVAMAVLPVVFGALSLSVPHRDDPYEVGQLLVVLNSGAVVMGIASTIRDLVAERRIFRREHSVGLAVPAYVAAKLLVFGLVAVVQTAALTATVAVGKTAPARGTVLPDHPFVELYLTLAATAVVSAVVGLTLSALAERRRELPALFLLASLVAVVFAGGMFPLAHRVGLNQLSWLVPSRWGFAASASTMDLGSVGLPGTQHELWTHSPSWWLSAMGVLLVFGALWTGALSWRLRMVSRR